MYAETCLNTQTSPSYRAAFAVAGTHRPRHVEPHGGGCAQTGSVRLHKSHRLDAIPTTRCVEEFHALAKVSDGHPHRTRLYDAHEDAYMTPYAEQDVAYIISLGYESIEHIVPRSYYARESAAQNDPFGWVVAASYKNSLRKNLPLVLWTSEGVGDNMYAELIIGDEKHFVPPVNQRARLARKWLYMRATHVATVPPSKAQQRRLTDILDHVERYPPDSAERRMNELLAHKYGGWNNPFISQPTEALRVARTAGWQRLVFGTAL